MKNINFKRYLTTDNIVNTILLITVITAIVVEVMFASGCALTLDRQGQVSQHKSLRDAGEAINKILGGTCKTIGYNWSDNVAVVVSKGCLFKEKITVGVLLINKGNLDEAGWEAAIMTKAILNTNDIVLTPIFKTFVMDVKGHKAMPFMVFGVVRFK